MVATAALLCCALGLASVDAKLRSASVKGKGKTCSFDSLAECEVAYDKLEAACMRPGSASGSAGAYHEESLGTDESGDGYRASGQHGSYMPPASYSGRPDGNGWDYHTHGEDWDQIGECGLPNQSPIDLAKYVDIRGQTKYVLWFDYYEDPDLKKTHKATIINDGHGISYDVAHGGVDLGFVKIGNAEYAASDYTFHSPSEHTMDGAVFPLELQIINRQRDGAGIVGVSLLFREGKSNAFLAGLMDALNADAPMWSMKNGAGVGTISGLFPDAFNLEALIPKSGPMQEHTFYNYQGSLTQPPCTSGVDWWILSEPLTATRDQIRFVRRAIFGSESTRHGNARATHPLDGRPIFVGLTGFQHAIKYHKLPTWHGKDSLQRPRGYDSQDMPWGDHWETKISETGAAPAPGPTGSPGSPGSAPGPAR